MLTLQLTEDEVPLSVPGGAVHELATSLGVNPARSRKLRVVIDELVNLARTREHGGRPAEVSVRAWTDRGFLHVEVADRGIPVFDEDPGILHELVRLGFAERIELSNHGRDGNSALCSLALADHEHRAHLADQEEVIAPDVPTADEFEQLEVRAMEAAECSGLARLVYRCYGYDYPSEDIYFPDRMSPLVQTGLMHSIVVVSPHGDLVGHSSLTRPTSEARIAEAGKLVVDPRYRAHGLAERMTTLRMAEAERLGLAGLWSECVTHHPYSQRNQLKLGARETGVFLGIMPNTVNMVGIESEQTQRSSLMAMYLPLCRDRAHTIHPPARYADLISRILDRLELERERAEGSRPERPGRLSVTVDRTNGVAVIEVATIGHDFHEQLEQRVDHLLDMHLPAIYLDLPLAQPGCAELGDHLTAFGFFFSAFLPEAAPDGDRLRLQFLNHEHPAPSEVKIASDWGEELLAACIDDQERVTQHLRKQRLADRT